MRISYIVALTVAATYPIQAQAFFPANHMLNCNPKTQQQDETVFITVKNSQTLCASAIEEHAGEKSQHGCWVYEQRAVSDDSSSGAVVRTSMDCYEFEGEDPRYLMKCANIGVNFNSAIFDLAPDGFFHFLLVREPSSSDPDYAVVSQRGRCNIGSLK